MTAAVKEELVASRRAITKPAVPPPTQRSYTEQEYLQHQNESPVVDWKRYARQEQMHLLGIGTTTRAIGNAKT